MASARTPFGFRDVAAEVEQEFLNPVLFDRLRRVVRGPILRVRRPLDFDRFRHNQSFRHGGRSVLVALAFADELDGEDVLALDVSPLVVQAHAVRAIEFLEADRPGFWESPNNGSYHMRGDPWTESRFQ